MLKTWNCQHFHVGRTILVLLFVHDEALLLRMRAVKRDYNFGNCNVFIALSIMPVIILDLQAKVVEIPLKCIH